jgi:hypothetical protein
VPTADLEDRVRFLLWCRAYWADIFDNEGWRVLARRHLARELAEVGKGTSESISSLLAECPPAAWLPEVARAMAEAAMRFDAQPFKGLPAKLREREQKRVTKEMKDNGVHSLRVTVAMREAVARSAVTAEDLFGEGKSLSERRRIARGLGVSRLEDHDAGRASENAVTRFKMLWNTYPRVLTLVGRCHSGRTRSLFEGEAMLPDKAPRLLLGPEDDDGKRIGAPIFVLQNRGGERQA